MLIYTSFTYFIHFENKIGLLYESKISSTMTY